MVVESSGGSDESDALPVDFWGDPVLVKPLVVRSTRPEMLDAVEETCDWDCVSRAREDRRVGEVPAMARRPRGDQSQVETGWALGEG